MKRPGPTSVSTNIISKENSSNNQTITYTVINKPVTASSNVTFRAADAGPPAVTTSTSIALPRQPSSSPHLLRYRRGASLMSLNSSSMSSQDVKSLREALVRHDASLNRAGAAVNHLQPVDRHALTARSHFRADPAQDVLAQHLRWSTTPTATSGNPGFAEAEVLAAARETYHPIAAPGPQMQISIKKIDSPSKSPIAESPSPRTSPPNQPVLLLNQRANSISQQQNRIVSIDNRPATTSSAIYQQQQARPHGSALSSASTTKILPGSADLRKQFDIYQRGTPFLPAQSSTKYFYKPEHGWLVKNIRERRSNMASIGGNDGNNNNNSSGSQQQLVSTANNNSTTELNSTLEVTKVASVSVGTTPPPPEQGSSRSSAANILARLSHTSQQQRLISANKTSISHVTLVDINAERDNVDGGNNAENSLKITPVTTNPLRTSTLSTKKTSTQPSSATQQASTSSTLHIEPSTVPQQQPRVSSSGPQPQMMVTSQQHPAAMRAKKLRDLFSSYDDFKRAAEDYASNFPKLPQDLTSSPYLNEAKQRQIWCWLHYGENISDVEYLLSVC